MKRMLAPLLALWIVGAAAQPVQVVDLPTRSGVTERMLVLVPEQPTATVLLLTGGPGHVNIRDDGTLARAENFLVRTRESFEKQGFAVLVLDAPSDRPRPVFLGNGFRDSAQHMQDLGAAVQWARQKFGKPVFIVGTSRGTQSTAHAAEVLTAPAGPDGIVLTSTILSRTQRGGDGRAVPEMDLERVAIPVLVVHHAEDSCVVCNPSLLPSLMKKFPPGRAELKTYTGGANEGDPCEPWAHHGYNGIEDRVVTDIATWIKAHS
jgi:pimeloyl-ACP methyl ester carboxylesterase